MMMVMIDTFHLREAWYVKIQTYSKSNLSINNSSIINYPTLFLKGNSWSSEPLWYIWNIVHLKIIGICMYSEEVHLCRGT